MGHQWFIFIGCLWILSYFSAAKAINCFQCTAKDPGCDTLTVDNTTSEYYRPCPDETHFCRKITQTIVNNDKKIIARTCSWLTENPQITKCFKYDTTHMHETVCQCYENGCNSAFSITQKVSISFAMSFVLIPTFINWFAF